MFSCAVSVVSRLNDWKMNPTWSRRSLWGSRTRPRLLIRGFQAADSYWLIKPPGSVDVGSCRGPAWGRALPDVAGAAAALDAAAGCCSAQRRW
jgi:hypothetical protein